MGETKVDKMYLLVFKKHVGCGEIAMDDVVFVELGYKSTHLMGNVCGVGACEDVFYLRSIDELHCNGHILI